MKEILLAVLGVLGVAIPSVLQLMTGESRRLRNMTTTAELLGKLPDDLDDVKKLLTDALHSETKSKTIGRGHPLPWMVSGGVVFLGFLVCMYYVMQPPGSGQSASEARSIFILAGVVLYFVGAVLFVHGVHLLGRTFHLFAHQRHTKAEG